MTNTYQNLSTFSPLHYLFWINIGFVPPIHDKFSSFYFVDYETLIQTNHDSRNNNHISYFRDWANESFGFSVYEVVLWYILTLPVVHWVVNRGVSRVVFIKSRGRVGGTGPVCSRIDQTIHITNDGHRWWVAFGELQMPCDTSSLHCIFNIC